MEPLYNLKQEIDEKLKQVKLTEQMKNNIRLHCQKEKVIRPKRLMPSIYKKACILVASIFAFTGSLMAMDCILGLELFFDKENLAKASKEIQSIQSYSEKNDVYFMVEEVIRQPYSLMITLSFINQTDKPWQEGIACKDIEFDIKGRSSMSSGPGILSEDGKRLSYCIEVNTLEEIKEDLITVEAKNLISYKEIEKQLDIPLGDLYLNQGEVLYLGNVEQYTSSDEPYYKLLDKVKRSKQTIILNKAYPSVYLIGTGYLIDDETIPEERQDIRSGFILYTRNDEYTPYTNRQSDDYLAGAVTELMDARTGKKYESQGIYGLEDGLNKGEVRASCFPDIKEEQIPYLKATKVTYMQQDVISKENWKVAFEVQDNNQIQKWLPNIQWECEDRTAYIEEIYLGTRGIELKVHSVDHKTQEIIGHPEALEIQLITHQEEVIELSEYGATGIFKKGEIQGYLIKYGIYDDKGDEKFIDIDNIKAVVINDKVLEIGESKDSKNA